MESGVLSAAFDMKSEKDGDWELIFCIFCIILSNTSNTQEE